MRHGDGFDYVRIAAGVLELGQLQEVLPPRAAFTASTATWVYGWVRLPTLSPEVVVVVPDGTIYNAVPGAPASADAAPARDPARVRGRRRRGQGLLRVRVQDVSRR
jgi:hypothetical protein